MIICVVLCAAYMTKAQVSYPSYAKGLKFQSEDESVQVKFSFRSQSLVTYDQAGFFGDSAESAEVKALVRRMRLKFGGYVFNPNFEYKLELGFTNRDIGSGSITNQVNKAPNMILDAVLKYHLSEHSTIWFGQTKLPGNRERVISSQALQFVDRSDVNSKFNIDRDFGIQYRYNNSIGEVPFNVALAVSAGEGRNITITNEGGYCYTGRVEVFPFGAFTKKGDYFGSDLKREEKPKLSLAASYDFNQQTNRSMGQLGTFVFDTAGNYMFNDIATTFVDMMFKFNGWSVAGEYAIRTLGEEMSGFKMGNGGVIQAGYLFDNNMELAARYTSVNLGSNENSLSNRTEYTLCLSNYILEHKLKWQTDVAMINGEDFRFRFQLEFGI